MPENRRLAAVMFSDICGYTTMMGEDESKALAVLKRNHAIHKEIIEKHNGHYVKDIGDGILAWFDSATNAVECALAILMATTNEEFELRFGIHEGDIVIQDGDILGSGVNVASRIEASAIPGSILFSSKVYDSLKSQSHLSSVRLDSFKLKNDHQPRDLYALAVSPCKVPMPGQVRAKRFRSNKFSSWLNPLLVILAVVTGLILLWYNNRNDKSPVAVARHSPVVASPCARRASRRGTGFVV